VSDTTIPRGIILGAVALAAGACIYFGNRAGKKNQVPLLGTGLTPGAQTELETDAMKAALELALL
jgi:hypothetical protein